MGDMASHPELKATEQNGSLQALQDVDFKVCHKGCGSGRLARVDRPKGRLPSGPIETNHRKYLRFTFKGRSYQWLVLPFGLGQA